MTVNAQEQRRSKVLTEHLEGKMSVKQVAELVAVQSDTSIGLKRDLDTDIYDSVSLSQHRAHK